MVRTPGQIGVAGLLKVTLQNRREQLHLYHVDSLTVSFYPYATQGRYTLVGAGPKMVRNRSQRLYFIPRLTINRVRSISCDSALLAIDALNWLNFFGV